ncbi:MAG: calcium/sodium antiporter [Gemmatimonadota bacterium]
MAADLLLLATGATALAVGADWLVSGCSRLAGDLGVPPVVTGLTVVAFGTSAPELVVSVDAAWRGQPGLAVGNVMGSTVANVGLIVGLSALIAPVAVHRRLVTREGPLVVAVLAAVVALFWNASLSRLEALALVACFLLYAGFLLRWTLRRELGALVPSDPEEVTPGALFTEPGDGPTGAEEVGTGESGSVNRLAEAGKVLAGLGGLLLGADWLVEAASALARGLGVSEAVVGATVVAVGTSLPELASSAAAGLRGLGDVAVGNVLGSNVFNLTLVLGSAAAVRPFRVAGETVTTQVVPWPSPSSSSPWRIRDAGSAGWREGRSWPPTGGSWPGSCDGAGRRRCKVVS